MERVSIHKDVVVACEKELGIFTSSILSGESETQGCGAENGVGLTKIDLVGTLRHGEQEGQ